MSTPVPPLHWCTTKMLTGLCSFSANIVGFDLVVSHTKLRLVIVAQTYSVIFSLFTEFFLNKVYKNNIQYARHF